MTVSILYDAGINVKEINNESHKNIAFSTISLRQPDYAFYQAFSTVRRVRVDGQPGQAYPPLPAVDDGAAG